MLEQAECDADGIYTGRAGRYHRTSPRPSAHLNLAQKIAEIGSWEWSLISDDHWASDQCYRILGLDPKTERFGLDSWCSIIHPDERDVTQARLRAEMAARRPYTLQYRLALKDGQVRTVIESGEPLSDDALCRHPWST